MCFICCPVHIIIYNSMPNILQLRMLEFAVTVLICSFKFFRVIAIESM